MNDLDGRPHWGNRVSLAFFRALDNRTLIRAELERINWQTVYQVLAAHPAELEHDDALAVGQVHRTITDLLDMLEAAEARAEAAERRVAELEQPG